MAPRKHATPSGVQRLDGGQWDSARHGVGPGGKRMQGSTCVRAATTTPSAMLTVIGMRVPGPRLSRQGGWVAWRSILGRLPGRGGPSAESARGGSPAYPLCYLKWSLLSAVPRVVKFTPGLSAVVAEEGCEATFQCVTLSDVAVTWFPDGVQLQPGEKPHAEGCQPQPDHLKPGPGGCRPGHCGG